MAMTARQVLHHGNWWRNLIFVFIALLALVVTIILPRHIHYDDAAITYRYVDRLSSGHGLTYNDHEKVFGASNPLYVLILSVVRSTLDTISAEQAAAAICSLSFVAVVMLVAYLTTMLSDLLTGIFASLLLMVDFFFRSQALSGMESTFGTLLGLLVIVGILKEKETLTGIFLGLAIWNKLDAGLLALAVAIAWLIIYKKFPWKIALVSFLVVLPWFLFSFIYYGTFLPNSIAVKLFIHSQGQRQNYFWVFNILKSERTSLVLTSLSLFSLLFIPRVEPKIKIALMVAALWFVFHGAVFSVINLGGEYPWYVIVLFPLITILGCTFIGKLTRYILKKDILASLAQTLLIVLVSIFGFTNILYLVRAKNPVSPFEAFDNDRRLAGIFIDRFADKSEAVQAAFGWVAYEIKNPFNDITQLNSKTNIEPSEYYVAHGMDYQSGNNPPKPIAGLFFPLATFNLTNDLYPGWSWFTVYGKKDSKIAMSGKRYLQYRLFELPKPKPFSAGYGFDNVSLDGIDLVMPPGSGAVFQIRNDHQPVHIVFLPSFDYPSGKDTSGGITYAVQSNSTTIYRRHLLEREQLDPVILSLPDVQSQESVAVAFVTRYEPNENHHNEHSIWKNVKIIVGDAYVDQNRITDKLLRDSWQKWNPVGKK